MIAEEWGEEFEHKSEYNEIECPEGYSVVVEDGEFITKITDAQKEKVEGLKQGSAPTEEPSKEVEEIKE